MALHYLSLAMAALLPVVRAMTPEYALIEPHHSS